MYFIYIKSNTQCLNIMLVKFHKIEIYLTYLNIFHKNLYQKMINYSYCTF